MLLNFLAFENLHGMVRGRLRAIVTLTFVHEVKLSGIGCKSDHGKVSHHTILETVKAGFNGSLCFNATTKPANGGTVFGHCLNCCHVELNRCVVLWLFRCDIW